MTSFVPGDRVRVESIGDDGFPLVRYGFVRGRLHDDGPVTVMLDDELNGTTVVDLSQIEPVSIANLELRLEGADLVHDPGLRHGLVNLWFAEAEQAGLEICELRHLDALRQESAGGHESAGRLGYALAELSSGGEQYVLRAACDPGDAEVVHVRVEPHRPIHG